MSLKFDRLKGREQNPHNKIQPGIYNAIKKQKNQHVD